jgi:uncharacterized protein YbcI
MAIESSRGYCQQTRRLLCHGGRDNIESFVGCPILGLHTAIPLSENLTRSICMFDYATFSTIIRIVEVIEN